MGDSNMIPAGIELRGVNLMIGKSLMPNGRCAFCRYQIHVLEEPNFAVIKVAVIKVNIEEKRVYAKCPKCKNWLFVPLKYSPDSSP
jgi:hypothetical protein